MQSIYAKDALATAIRASFSRDIAWHLNRLYILHCSPHNEALVVLNSHHNIAKGPRHTMVE